MKILICSINSKYIHASLSPWYLKAGIEDFSRGGHECHVFESTVNADETAQLEYIVKTNAELVGFCCYIWNIERVLSIAKELKQRSPNVKIVLGGPEVSYRASGVLGDYRFVDFVLSGEGEWDMARLCDKLDEGGELSEVSSLSFRSGEKITEGVPFVAKCDPPNPYREEFFKALDGRISYIESSRGCPFSCAFCLSGSTGRLRHFDLCRTTENLLKLANSGTKTVKFVDRTFNADHRHADKILQFILENAGGKIPEGVCFHFEIAGDILQESTLQLLEAMPKGLVQLEIGMQSFNEETLKKIHRKTDTKRLCDNIKRLRQNRNLHLHIDLIAGLWGEDYHSFRQSFNRGYSLGADMLQMGFLKLLYGAQMRENKTDFPCTYSPLPPYEVTSTPWLSSAEILSLKRTEDALDRLYNSGRFSLTLNYLTEDALNEPFGIFETVGEKINGAKMPLKTYITRVFEVFSTLDGVDKAVLRDKMTLDRLLSDSTADLPDCLRIEDKRLSLLKKRFAKKATHVGVGILYTENAAVAVDYSHRDKVTNRYKFEKYPLDDLF